MNYTLIKKYLAATPVEILPRSVQMVLDRAAAKWLVTNELALAEELKLIDDEIVEKQTQRVRVSDSLSLISTKTVDEILHFSPVDNELPVA